MSLRRATVCSLLLLAVPLSYNHCTRFAPAAQAVRSSILSSTTGSSASPSSTPSPTGTTSSQQTLNMGVNLLTPCSSYHSHWGYPGDLPKVAWDYDYFRSKGLTVFRVTILWESLQPTLNGPLTDWQVKCLHDVLNLATAHQVKLVFDIHNYARYVLDNQGGTLDQTDKPNDSDQAKMGTSDLPISAMTSLWTKMATEFHDDPGLAGYDLMNEPHDLADGTIWPTAAQAAVTAIRTVDKQTPVIVEGYQWASASNWVYNNPSLNIQDPAGNLIYSAHEYFDNGSGLYLSSYDSYGTTSDIGVTRAKPFVDWLESHGYRGQIGEFGAPADDPRWLTVVDNFLSYIVSHHVGATAFAGGYLWEEFGQAGQWYNLEPAGGENMPASPVDRGEMAILKKYPTQTY